MIIERSEDWQAFKIWVQSKEFLAYDIETSGLEPRKEDIVIGIGVSDSNRGFYLPLYAYSGEQLVAHSSLQYISEFLSILKTKQLLCFNGAFDIPFTKHVHGVDLLDNLHTDVLLLKHTVDEEFPFKLKEIAVQVFGYGAASEQRDLQQELKAAGASKHELFKANYSTIGKYCVQDCLLTYRLYNYYLGKLRQEGLEQFFYENEVMPLYKHVTIPMTQYGLKLDVQAMQKALEEITADIEAIESNIQTQIKPLLGVFEAWFLNKDYPPSRSGNFAQGIVEYAGLGLPKTASGKYSLTEKNIQALPDSIYKQVLLKQEYLPAETVLAVQRLLAQKEHGDKPLFNLQSKHHLKKLFFDTLQLEPLSTTDLGNPQVDDEFIHSIAHKYEWANDLHVYNRLQKIKATYIERLLEGQIDGVFYPSFFQHRTISGRYGSDLQQMPRKVSEADEPSAIIRKYVNAIRDFIITRDEHKLVGADYESLEPHIFAHVSGDIRLQNIFTQGLDFYSEIAIRTEGLTEYSSLKTAENYLGKVNKSKRQQAKAYALGIPYGMSGYKLAFQLECGQEHAEHLVESYLNAFPDLKKWIEDTHKFVLQHGYIKSQAGRIRHLKRAKEIASKFGLTILDSLHLYKEYGHDEAIYEHMKETRRLLKNYLNNACNFQIQSLAASIVNQAAIAMSKAFKLHNLSAQICLNIHDELVVEVPDSEVQAVCKIMQQIMQENIKLSVPLKAEPQVALKYGDTK